MTRAPSRYELLDRIAVGGMAEVYRAKAFGAHGFEKTLAIKRILPELAKNPEFEERFIDEAKLAVQLSHANIVQVLDFGRFGGTLFLAMELVSGLDLATLLQTVLEARKQVPISAAFQIAMELLRGLSFAHHSGVVHRDVSPSNILLSKAGEVKIADFGIATAMQKEWGSDEGRIMGKWRYMSPEQTEGQNLDARSDIFSAAVVIYELFAGKKLFPGTTSEEISENIHSMPIPKLSEIRPEVPQCLERVLSAALERDPKKRQKSAEDFLRALTEASYESGIVATSMDVAEAVVEACEMGARGTTAKPAALLDDLIRAQLANVQEAAGLERSTEVAAVSGTGDMGTLVRKGVDPQGVTVWQLDPTIAASPVALRKSDTTTGRRQTESVDTRRRDKDRLWAVLTVVATFACIWIAFVSVREPRTLKGSSTNTVARVQDAEIPGLHRPLGLQTLRISSVPSGAQVMLGNEVLDETTPVSVKVRPELDIEVTLRLAGHAEYSETVRLIPGQNLGIRPTLRPLVSVLIIDTTPKGATVVLNGKRLGQTPYFDANVPPGLAQRLELTLKDYTKVVKEIDLLPDKELKVVEVLKSELVYGFVNLNVTNTWARVFSNGKFHGNAPRRFRLRVGSHRLRLVNPESGRSTTVDVEVFADRVETYNVTL